MSCRFSVYNVIKKIDGEYANIVVADDYILYPLSAGIVRCMDIYVLYHIVQHIGRQLCQIQMFLCRSDNLSTLSA